MELPDGFYQQLDQGVYRATSSCIGPWGPTLSHGGPPIALLGREFEQFDNPFGLKVLRLSVEILGPMPLGDYHVKIGRERSGRKIELLSAEVTLGDRTLLLARCWRMLEETDRGEVHGDVRAAPPRPNHSTSDQVFPTPDRIPYIDAIEWRFTEGGFGEIGPATVWARPRIPTVIGTSPSSLERALVIMDSANGISNVLSFDRWSFVPVDLTYSALREPIGEWIVLKAKTTTSAGGLGVTKSALGDDFGPFAWGLHTLYIQSRS